MNEAAALLPMDWVVAMASSTSCPPIAKRSALARSTAPLYLALVTGQDCPCTGSVVAAAKAFAKSLTASSYAFLFLL
ncbi:hypothetical protein RKD26_000157 [Streptomyces calvus]